MSFLGSLRQKTPFFDKIAESFTPAISRDEKFKYEYRLPAEENIIDDTNADISFVGAYSKIMAMSRSKTEINQKSPVSYVYSGRLYLTPHFLVFRDAFDQYSCVLVMNLSTIKRVERSPSESHSFALNITLYSGSKISIQFIGLRYRSEQFSHQLKLNLKNNIETAKNLPQFLSTCYSEFIITKNILHQKDLIPPRAGLGQQFKYPGRAELDKEKAKLRLWFEYFKENGQNMAIVKNHMFQKLIRVGLPNRIRGEIWELCSGSIYLRHANSGEYQKILRDNEGKTSQAIDEIEKDLKRSLPEYRAYQSEEGIGRLRNVLTAYSWKNPDVGYCQAMNIVVAGLLIFMTEEQAFWCLTKLCDIYVPGYYSKTMYGTLLDQKVFEAFVEDRLPILWKHIVQNDIQLSVISLPWFLSLFFTSMPLEYAFRIMDIFFLNGAKTLFQVALAVLKVNADDLSSAEEDGTFIAVLKNYFQTLGDSAYPESDDTNRRQITKFQELLVTAFKEFSIISEGMIIQERNKHQKGILQNIETFVKRTQMRQMPKTFNLTDEDLSNIYDIYYQSIETHKISMGTGSSSMSFDVFIQLLSKFCDWCKPSESDENPAFRKQKTDFLKKLFRKWDSNHLGELTLNDVVTGIDNLKSTDLLQLINYFFSLYDTDNDGELHREEVLQVSEGLLFLTEPWKTGRYIDLLTKQSIEDDIAEKLAREKFNEENTTDEIDLPSDVQVDEEKCKIEQSERYLKAASSFLQRSFEYAKSFELAEEIDLINFSDDELDGEAKKKKFNTLKANVALDPTRPKLLDLATFRMIILADETYELFFASTWGSSIHTDQPIENVMKNRPLRSMFDGIIADGRRVAEQVRRRVDSVTTRGSITSVESAGAHTINSGSVLTSSYGSSKEDRFDDLDDFSHEHQEEHEDLLGSSWVEMEMENEGPNSPDRHNLKTVPTRDLDSQGDLIEFEA
ncbi:hypothetical protein Kpol_359p9 [Vanderwaltozyma polyspora DSM 70294]|uniref:Rab-GAP TBC domain-containing protein n=1 Tax=Vanderwaltozyma polyspora (strain ATCC 22028 / DSM 70294 / BCRC 21397 / CBS 2163 / NBRC 10782 / NRRL Y-8283 / UCD 57-17) TaxID=436907 RepID=A7TSB1_VANPO|nr:uncharacterized protein Kpol_359p9 [Vanderwaltozyma polyspora DSM 70294]EDO14848.1 hypothetical protein Kpol_359p9 [Vanderwaltozyma polyspora DSM 70294]